MDGFLVAWQMCQLLLTCTWKHHQQTDLLFRSSLCLVSNSPCHRWLTCTSISKNSHIHQQWQHHHYFQHSQMPTSLQSHPHWCRWHLHHISNPSKSPTHPRRVKLHGRCNFTQELSTCMPVRTWYCYIIIHTPSIAAGGSPKMISSSVHSRQPLRWPWTCKRLFREWAITLGQAIDNSTWKNYSSALNSYLNFIKMHDFPLEPTSETLSLFTVCMSHHIKPNSVATYLSGICQQLEPYFPNVHSAWNSALVHHTLQGCRRLHWYALHGDECESAQNAKQGSSASGKTLNT